MAWNVIANGLLVFLGQNEMLKYTKVPEYIYVPYAYSFFFTCIFAPMWEELFFRYGIIGTANKAHSKYVPQFLMMSSIIFGYLHGNSPEGILVQGVIGYIIGSVYIKNGFSILSAIMLHFMLNLTAVHFS